MSPENFCALLWGDERHRHELHFISDGERCVSWIPCDHHGRLARLLDTEACFVSAVPRLRRDAYTWGDAHQLWVSLSKPESCQRLQRFTPTPSMVWREAKSSRRWAAWGLCGPLGAQWVQQATERLAHHLGGRRKDADPAALMPSPFSGKWWVEHSLAEFYTPRQIVGGLRDAPDPKAWRAAA